MSAHDELRAAATRLRTLATEATPGPWDASGWVYGDTTTESYGVWAGDINMSNPRDPIAKTSRLKQGGDDASLIATMDPRVAHALSYFLFEVANTWESMTGEGHEQRANTSSVIAIARAINGGAL